MTVVAWLDTRNDQWYSRRFESWSAAESFILALRRKFPHSPIEVPYREREV